MYNRDKTYRSASLCLFVFFFFLTNANNERCLQDYYNRTLLAAHLRIWIYIWLLSFEMHTPSLHFFFFIICEVAFDVNGFLKSLLSVQNISFNDSRPGRLRRFYMEWKKKAKWAGKYTPIRKRGRETAEVQQKKVMTIRSWKPDARQWERENTSVSLCKAARALLYTL